MIKTWSCFYVSARTYFGCDFQEQEVNSLTREIQAQERKTTSFETTVRHMESDIEKKRRELHCKKNLYSFK